MPSTPAPGASTCGSARADSPTISVTDDGHGMSPEDAPLAFARHATSKLSCAEDLAVVRTLGFRGEALPSIAAVARVRVVTRRLEDAAATVVDAGAAGAERAGVAGAPVGTSIEVHELFGATPARRKFLRTPQTEMGHVVDVLTRLAIASPTTGFTLEHDGREVLSLPAVADLRARLTQVLGPARAASLVELDALGGVVGAHGFLGPPRETVASARLIWSYLAVEDGAARPGATATPRYVRDKLVMRAILDGYESLLMRGRYPIAVVILRVPAGEVDVNVHPAKLEVRFRRPAVVHQLIAPALRSRLAAALNPLAPPASLPAASPPRSMGWSPSLGATAEGGVAEVAPSWRGIEVPAPAPESAVQSALWRPAPEGFAALRLVGQVLEGYLVCEGAGRVVLIDQHAAHERVMFERLRAAETREGVARDPLLVPEAVAVSRTEGAALAEHAAALAALGLEGEPFGEGTFLLRTVPRLLRGRDPAAIIRAVAADLADGGTVGAAVEARDHVLATIACHSAVRVGQTMDATEVRALLAAMDAVDVNAHCPHGRPVAVELSRGQIETLFRR